jgi:carboxypeptidase C (cathepsin A)
MRLSRLARFAAPPLALFAALSLGVRTSAAQQRQPAGQAPAASSEAKPAAPAAAEAAPVVTHHEIHVNGKVLRYTATTGRMPIAGEDGKVEGRMFFVAYTLDNAGSLAQRPLVIAFNGGPGAGSLWLQIGAIGPRRVDMGPNPMMPRPPFHLVDNAETWLDFADLVFVDPVGTGYSRPESPQYGKNFWGLRQDLQSVGEFIRLYLTRYDRWQSPLFLAGESYGTTRAAGLSGYLMHHGIAFNGIVLLSTALDFEAIDFNRGNDLPYVLFLPTYTATAWYHKRLAADLQQQPLEQVVQKSEEWAESNYLEALAKGDRLSGAERDQTIATLEQLTGLPRRYISDSDLRVDIGHFTKELLLDTHQTVGRLDSRFTAYDLNPVSAEMAFDPSESAIRPPFTAMFVTYVRDELNYHTDLEYYALGGGIKAPWDWGRREGYPNVTESLREALVKNPYMKVFIGEGYYDLATPFAAADYVVAHLQVEPPLEKNIEIDRFPAGHMMYIHPPSLVKLKNDVTAFVSSSLAQ